MKRSAEAWLELAARDLEAAQLLVGNEYVANIVIFHCQQCVEKSLKALLEEAGGGVPRVHGIHKLSTLVEGRAGYHLPLSEEDKDTLARSLSNRNVGVLKLICEGGTSEAVNYDIRGCTFLLCQLW